MLTTKPTYKLKKLRKSMFLYTYIYIKSHKIETKVYKIQISNNFLKLISFSCIFTTFNHLNTIFYHSNTVF